jgi:hypothetical protein
MHAGRERVCGALVDAVDEAIEPADDPFNGCMEIRSVDTTLLQRGDLRGDPCEGDQKMPRQRRICLEMLGRRRIFGGSVAV